VVLPINYSTDRRSMTKQFNYELGKQRNKV